MTKLEKIIIEYLLITLGLVVLLIFSSKIGVVAAALLVATICWFLLWYFESRLSGIFCGQNFVYGLLSVCIINIATYILWLIMGYGHLSGVSVNFFQLVIYCFLTITGILFYGQILAKRLSGLISPGFRQLLGAILISVIFFVLGDMTLVIFVINFLLWMLVYKTDQIFGFSFAFGLGLGYYLLRSIFPVYLGYKGMILAGYPGPYLIEIIVMLSVIYLVNKLSAKKEVAGSLG